MYQEHILSKKQYPMIVSHIMNLFLDMQHQCNRNTTYGLYSSRLKKVQIVATTHKLHTVSSGVSRSTNQAGIQLEGLIRKVVCKGHVYSRMSP